jgi:hypothetical protein
MLGMPVSEITTESQSSVLAILLKKLREMIAAHFLFALDQK